MCHDEDQTPAPRLSDRRRVYVAENTPDDVAEWLLPALDRFANGEDAEVESSAAEAPEKNSGVGEERSDRIVQKRVT